MTQTESACLAGRTSPHPAPAFHCRPKNAPPHRTAHAPWANQCNLEQFFTLVDEFDDREKTALFYLTNVNGQSMEDAVSNLDDVSLFEGHLKEAAEELFDECYAHEIPESLRCYIDYEAFARDCELGGDMYEFEFADKTYTCTNAACV